ncbi:hypothetical protein QYE76_028881 [Lolium multiflorum]|uniref:Retrotransposon gag domain-containing protein n=1 Tax=Lolium multiflorum TaxID=4521 RepID=A0AAD8VHR1_LOLMU|nr:hypothetical protein QYE76_028881 [Lolium multiflorum]
MYIQPPLAPALDRIRKFDVEIIDVRSNTDDDAANIIGDAVGAITAEAEDAFPQSPVRLDSEKAFAQCDKDRHVQDRIGRQLVKLKPINKKKTAQKLVDRRGKTADKMVNKTNPILHWRLWVAFLAGKRSASFSLVNPNLFSSDHKIVNQENKNSADIITWREYEALRNEMRREFRTKDDELKSTVDEIKQTLDATNVTVTGLADQMTDIQRNIADMRLAIENLTAQQQQQQQQQDDDEDPELEDDAHNARGAPRGHRPRGWVPLGRNGHGQDEEDGLGKPKFSIPKFEGGADVEEYLTWELKIEKLWSLHPHYSEDRKIKLASSEFDGYALRWWDSLVRNLDEDGAQPIRTWHAMKEAMTSRFVPTNYMRNIFYKLTLLRQGVKTVDEYYMEMEMLMQRGRVRTCYGSWAFYTPCALYGADAFDALRSLLYSA